MKVLNNWKKVVYRFFLGSILISMSFSLSLSSVYAGDTIEVGQTKILKVSAYYSPIPGQKRYATGFYEGDLKLQGNGVAGADGTPVYVGMISAPPSYPFGTKIYIENLGVGTVHDRGGAIYAATGYDRLDVWMGTGDEGLERALQWGIRTVTGEIMPEGTPDSIGLNEGVVGTDNSTNHNQEAPEVYFSKDYERGNTGDDVEKLQRFLTYEGFLDTKEFGIFNQKTHYAVYRFQRSYGVVSSLNDLGAGRWGPKTRATANAVLYKRNTDLDSFPEFTENMWYGKFSVENSDIRTIQRFLKRGGYYKGSVNGRYTRALQYGIYLFQKDNGIVDFWQEEGAGAWGPKTRKIINEL